MNKKLKKQSKRKPDPRGYGITASVYLEMDTYQLVLEAAKRQDRTTSKIIAMCVTAHIQTFTS